MVKGTTSDYDEIAGPGRAAATGRIFGRTLGSRGNIRVAKLATSTSAMPSYVKSADRERAEGRQQGRSRPKAAVFVADKDGHPRDPNHSDELGRPVVDQDPSWPLEWSW